MSISTSTCHICLEELDFDLKYLKKKCCPTQAFICNGCWEKIMNTEEIVFCPLCRQRIKSDKIVPVSALNLVRDIESQRVRTPVSRKDKVNKYLINYVLITLLGAIGILTSVYFLHPHTTTFEEEFKYLTVRPFFWIMSSVYGLFFLMFVDLLFGRVLMNRMRGGL